MKFVAFAAVFLFSTAAHSAEDIRVKALDFGLDWRTYVGKRVTVEGCEIVRADLQSFACQIRVGNNTAGTVSVDTKKVEREVLKQLVTVCTDILWTDNPQCVRNVSGVVKENFMGEPELVKGSVEPLP